MIRKCIERLISYFKKDSFKFDQSIPSTYIVSYFASLFIIWCYSLLYIRRKGIYMIHPSSHIRCKSLFKFEKNLFVDRDCYINALSYNGIQLGKNVVIGKKTTIECSGSFRQLGKGLLVGDNVGLGTHCFYGCAGGITIGSNTIIGNYVSFHSENHNYHNPNILIKKQGVSHKGIIIGENCWIGAKVTILDGAIIGNGCVIAAGAVVRGSFPDNVIIGGIPAKIIKNRIS